MFGIFDLWLPILVSAIFVFVTSSLIHMLLPYHKSDFKKLDKEDELLSTMRPFNLPPGDYMAPMCDGSKDGMKSPEYKDKLKNGPIFFMTILSNSQMSMGSSLIMWFVYSILVSIFAAYIAGHAVGVDAYYLSVFRFVGATAFVGYSLALLQNSIWYKKNWAATLKSIFDGLIYALVTAGVFGWLWPTV